VKGDAEQAALESFVALFVVVSVSALVAKRGGIFKRDYGKSRGVGPANAPLAASPRPLKPKMRS
jgi:hypothetical protein